MLRAAVLRVRVGGESAPRPCQCRAHRALCPPSPDQRRNSRRRPRCGGSSSQAYGCSATTTGCSRGPGISAIPPPTSAQPDAPVAKVRGYDDEVLVRVQSRMLDVNEPALIGDNVPGVPATSRQRRSTRGCKSGHGPGWVDDRGERRGAPGAVREERVWDRLAGLRGGMWGVSLVPSSGSGRAGAAS